ncbi:hypothetical protein HWV62_23486 [Athelia sp. TMB]|nr:hypothetical protein HWV62_23486 [Athelia sp. TMB]
MSHLVALNRRQLDHDIIPRAVLGMTPEQSPDADQRLVTFDTSNNSGKVYNSTGLQVHGDHAIVMGNIYVGSSLVSQQSPAAEPSPRIYTLETISRSRGAIGPPSDEAASNTNIAINIRYCDYDIRSPGEIRAITELVDALRDNTTIRHSKILAKTLTSLKRMLELAKLIVQVYRYTLLASTVDDFLLALVEHCRRVLRQLLSDLQKYRHAFSEVIWRLIRMAWSTIGESKVMSTANTDLRNCHVSFASCILALGRAAWPEVQRVPGADPAVLAAFYDILKQESTDLRHIVVDAICVVDHLGRKLPVPTIFCSSWKARSFQDYEGLTNTDLNFHIVIVGFCRGVQGDKIVEKGDYRILQDDEQFIDPEHFSAAIRPEMTVEMSIVIREMDKDGAQEHQCPRCQHINRKVFTQSVWATCQSCFGQFQVESQTMESVVREAPTAHDFASPAVEDMEESTKSNWKSFCRRICLLTTVTISGPLITSTYENIQTPLQQSWEATHMAQEPEREHTEVPAHMEQARHAEDGAVKEAALKRNQEPTRRAEEPETKRTEVAARMEQARHAEAAAAEEAALKRRLEVALKHGQGVEWTRRAEPEPGERIARQIPDKIRGLDVTHQVQFMKDSSTLLGEGRISRVYSGSYTRANGQQIPVAVKCFALAHHIGPFVTRRLHREALTRKRVSPHENVSDLLGVFLAPHGPPYLVLPFFRHNNLLRYSSQAPNSRLALAKDVARGLDHLHGNGVIHGNIKSENVMVSDNGRAQLVDFGFPSITNMESFSCITVMNWNARHTAPELLPISEVQPQEPTKESDIFSLGILFLQLFDGRRNCLPYWHYPFTYKGPYNIALIRAIHRGDRPRRGDYNFNYPGQENHWSLIEACWAADPRSRPTASHVRRMLA